MEKPAVTTMLHKKLVSMSLNDDKVRVERLYFNMFMKIKVLLGNAGYDDSRVALIVESAELSSWYANSYTISSNDAKN